MSVIYRDIRAGKQLSTYIVRNTNFHYYYMEEKEKKRKSSHVAAMNNFKSRLNYIETQISTASSYIHTLRTSTNIWGKKNNLKKISGSINFIWKFIYQFTASNAPLPCVKPIFHNSNQVTKKKNTYNAKKKKKIYNNVQTFWLHLDFWKAIMAAMKTPHWDFILIV